MELLIFWLLFAILPAAAARSRGRSAGAWFLLAILISPLIALILVLVLPNQSSGAAASTNVSGSAESIERRAHAIGDDLPLVRTYQDVDQTGINPAPPTMYTNGDVEGELFNAGGITYDAVELELSLWGVPVRGMRPSLVRRSGVGSLLVFDRSEPFKVAEKTVVIKNTKPGSTKYKTKAPGKLPPNPIVVPVVKRVSRDGVWTSGREVDVEAVRRALLQPAGAQAGSTKRCPDCGEDVRAEARVCRFCRYEFEPSGT